MYLYCILYVSKYHLGRDNVESAVWFLFQLLSYCLVMVSLFYFYAMLAAQSYVCDGQPSIKYINKQMKSEKRKRLTSPHNISRFLLALPLNFASVLGLCILPEIGHSGCDASQETADGFSSWRESGCSWTIDLCGKRMGVAAPKDPPENETFPSMLKGRKVESARTILTFPHTPTE